MRKHGLGALALALVLTVTAANCFSLNVSAEEGDIPSVASETDDGSDDTLDESKTPLAAPTGLTWGDNYEMVFNAPEERGSCTIDIYKDGEPYMSLYLISRRNSITDSRLAIRLNESGTYKYRVRANAAADDTIHTDSEWSDWSEEKTYVRPDRQVGTTAAYWDTERVGCINFERVDNAECYRVDLYKDGDSVDRAWILPQIGMEIIETTVKWDFSSRIAVFGEGQYTIQVAACSTDLDQFANGEPGPMSDIYDTSVGVSNLSSILADAMANQSASDAAETLKNSADISAIQMAMQTSDSFRGQVKELEARYAAEKGITTSRNVSEEARAYVDPDKVEIVGAAFNAVGSNVQLSMNVTPEENKVPLHANYLNSVQLDIKLTSDSTEVHELEVPVSITMPVPAGIDVRQLVILHYHQDGGVECAAYHVNGDGTITFTVRRFSTFAFAEETGGSSNVGESDEASYSDSDDSSDFVDSVKDMILSAAPGSVVTITKEQGINALSNGAMKALLKRGDVTLVMEYTYLDKEYRIVIPAGKAEDNDIPWYGPLYLSAYYSSNAVPVAGQGDYTVKQGDTLGAIARANGMSLAQLAAKNPQIKDVNFIRIGQRITLK